ncbi:MAG: N-6 DNA methylase [Candidatus Ozemobacteraceae bacterium]
MYDPTSGSGGFLIQAHQYVDEQGQDANDLHLFGQDSNGMVWSICHMNMILHNINRFTIGKRHRTALVSWWSIARDDFAQLRQSRQGGKKMPEVRRELLTSIKDKLLSLGVFDEFQTAGIFVNWWQQIRYDLKTVISTGWHQTLIPDEYLVDAFFKADADAIEALETQIGEAQSELTEAAREIAAYEPDEDETVSAAIMKKVLKELIDDLKSSTGKSAEKEQKALKACDRTIGEAEMKIKDGKAELKIKTDELALKVQLKRLGDEEFKNETRELL